MTIRSILIPAIATIVGCISGYETCRSSINPLAPTDKTGRTSIVVILGDMDGDDWCELRGPARWDVLEGIGNRIGNVYYGDGTSKADYAGH